MTKPVPKKAEAAAEYPDKLYVATFDHTARADVGLDRTGMSLGLQQSRPGDARKSVRLHLHYTLLAEILNDLAKAAAALPPAGVTQRAALQDAAEALYLAFKASAADAGEAGDAADMTPQEEVRLLHIME